MITEAEANLRNVFFIVGPTASGKSDIAAEVAQRLRGEIVSADAFQIYEGFPILTAKPDAATVAKAPHHLIGTTSILGEMNAQIFRELALHVIADIQSRQNPVLVVGGSGLYIKALTHGLSADWNSVKVDPKGVFVFRDRAELHERINRRVEEMFVRGAMEEAGEAGAMSATAGKMIGLREIRAVLEDRISRPDAIAKIQQATRQYAKRQLTWFRHQTNFEPLNLSLFSHGEAVKWISERARRAFVEKG